MAIKGKGKTRSRRMVAASPRPQIVTRKRPFLLRRSTWIVAGIVVLAGAAFLAWHVWSNHQNAQELAKEQAALTAFRTQVDAALPADHSTPGGEEPAAVFTTLSATLDDATSGKLTPAKIRAAGRSIESDAAKSAKAMEAIKTTSLISGNFSAGPTTAMRTPGLTQLTASNAQQSMVNGLRIYQSIGGLVAAAADQPVGPKRAAIINEARALSSTAASTFGDNGYSQMIQLEATVGNIAPSTITPPGGTGSAG